MSTNQTPNYGLCQWEAEDKVLRTDFNADNAKIEAALNGLEARMTALERLSGNLAHYISFLGLLEHHIRKERLPSYSMFSDNFSVPALYSLAGGAVIADNALTLSGQGKIADITTVHALPNSNRNWTTVLLWIHASVPGVSASFGGRAMKHHSNEFSTPPGQSSSCWERLFTLDRGDGDYLGSLTLHLDCTEYDSVSVYDYCLFFI